MRKYKKNCRIESNKELYIQNKKADKNDIRFFIFQVCLVIFLASMLLLIINLVRDKHGDNVTEEIQQTVAQFIRVDDSGNFPVADVDVHGFVFTNNNAVIDGELSILPQYEKVYKQNPDMIGWLKIDNTVINYPVMQTPTDEEYYLYRGFDKSENDNGCLIMDTDSCVGKGTKESGYFDGVTPSTNLIIHGHTMKSGEMFGNLQLYQTEDYGREHSIISFDSIYEHREYELFSVFYSKVFYEDENVFKYYKFFDAPTQEEFDYWINNIKQMSLYDTGVTAEFGDEFITLSCCSYQTENGRFVVIGKRIL